MGNDKKAETKIFSIDEGEWNNEIPGVTRLITLNAQEMKKLKEVTSLIPTPKPEAVTVSPPVVAPAPVAAAPAPVEVELAPVVAAPPIKIIEEVKKEAVKPVTFSDLSIFVEHQYRLQGNRFVYQRSLPHDGSSPDFLKSWQKAILNGMEIDHKLVKPHGTFHEFPITQKAICEVFAGTAPAYVQMVRFPAMGDELSVFHSTQTCLIKKDTLLKLVEEAQKTVALQMTNKEPSTLIEPTTSIPSGAKEIELKKNDDDKIELDVA